MTDRKMTKLMELGHQFEKERSDAKLKAYKSNMEEDKRTVAFIEGKLVGLGQAITTIIKEEL